jgi:spermidine synthase
VKIRNGMMPLFEALPKNSVIFLQTMPFTRPLFRYIHPASGCSVSHPTAGIPSTILDAAKWQDLNLTTRYYNTDVHTAAFALPNFVRKMIDG